MKKMGINFIMMKIDLSSRKDEKNIGKFQFNEYSHHMPTGSRLRTLRIAKGLTLEQLSKKADVAIGLLSQLEKADEESANPSLQTLRKIAKGLGVTLADLLGKSIAARQTVVPERLDAGLSEFLTNARKRGMTIDEGVLQGCYGMQEREGAPKTAEDWEFLYKTIKMNFDMRRQNG